MPGGAPQTLPAQYVKSFQRWFISKNQSDHDASLEGLLGTSNPSENGDFVNPTSTTELWWPADIKKLQFRPTLDILFQSGHPAYASGGVDVRVPPESSADGTEWRNYGLNSQPLARQWTTFGFIVEPSFRVEAFVGRKVDGGSSAPQFTKLTDSAVQSSEQKMKKAVEELGVFVSELDESSPLSQGFHIVSLPTDEEWTDLPQFAKDSEGGAEPYALVTLATAEPDAKELLTMDSELVAMTATSIMAIDVSQTEPGGASEYLPEAYKPLYIEKGE